jgi:hypothetical protein
MGLVSMTSCCEQGVHHTAPKIAVIVKGNAPVQDIGHDIYLINLLSE